MAKPRAIIRRRKAVRNIRKITRTMQLIATARFQAALNRATASKPYTVKLAELVRDLVRAARDVDHELMKTHDESNRSVTLILTSNRGLCGAYNSNVLREAIAHVDALGRQDMQNENYMVGKKGRNYFKFLRRPITKIVELGADQAKFEEVEPLANDLMSRFVKGEIRAVYVAYMSFISVGQQKPVVHQLLPLKQEAVIGEGEQKAADVQYEFSPDPQSLLDDLLPATVRISLFQYFNEAAVSEQIFRMVAMKAATDAAGDMNKSLTRQYNRARQTQITMELLDIVGGANALD